MPRGSLEPVRFEADAPALIAVSGYGQRQDWERSRAAGFDYHLVKPTSLEHLSAILADVNA